MQTSFDKPVLKFVTPLPPSVNDYLGKTVIYVHGKPRVHLFETNEARAYKRLVSNSIKREVEKCGWEKTGEFEYVICEVTAYLSQKKRDSDNLFKCLLDAIKEADVVYDDCMVIPRVVDVFIDKDKPRLEVELYKATKVGIFPGDFVANSFVNKCEDCTRFSKNCSILRKCRENRIVPEVTKDEFSFKCSSFKVRKKSNDQP